MSDKRVYELVEYECQDGDCLMINEKRQTILECMGKLDDLREDLL